MFRVFTLVLVLLSSNLLCAGRVLAESTEDRISVVATFSILADLAREIGGEQVIVTSLVGLDEDAHVFHASPNDIRQVREADILLTNGLGFEGWLDRLVKASGFEGEFIVASKGVDVIKLHSFNGHHHHGDSLSHAHKRVDPHAWHSLKAVKRYVRNIHAGLVAFRPALTSYFDARLAAYIGELEELDTVYRRQLDALPAARKSFLVPHNAFAYLGREFGLVIHSLQGVSTETEASAQVVAKIIRQIRADDIQVMFKENVSDSRLLMQVEKEADIVLGGELISGALTQSVPTYITMMRHNLEQITRALKRQ